MKTVDDAQAAGKTHLEVFCNTCRVRRQVPWALLRSVLGTTDIADIPTRLICEKCGDRPDPAAVKPIHPNDGVVFPSKIY